MKAHRYLSHGIVAVAAWTVGGLCGYGFAPGQRASAGITPAAADVKLNGVAAPAAVASPTLATVSAEWPIATAHPATTLLIPNSKTITVPIPPDSLVASLESFRLDVPKGFPIVVVRAMDEESVWYVQDGCERAEGSLFTCTAVFGNASTTPGTKFEMAAIVAATAEQAQQFVPGTILKELPSDMTITPVIKVVR